MIQTIAVIKRPMLPLAAVKAILGVGENRIHTLIDEGALEYAFDIRLTGSERACLRVLTVSVCAYQSSQGPKVSLDDALAFVFPKTIDTFRSCQIADRLVCDKSHVAHLVRAGLLRAVAPRRGFYDSLPVDRRCCLEFLKSRRVL